jgi:hypothetical protein
MTMDTAFDTEVSDDSSVINEALAIIDRGLGQFLHRELVSTAEASDLLLDVRSILVGLQPDVAPTPN